MTKQKILTIHVILIILAIVITALFFIFRELNAKKHGALNSYTWSFGGDMVGSYRYRRIEKVDEERAMVHCLQAAQHNQDPETAEYYVPISVLQEVERLYDQYKIYRFPFLPESHVKVLDAGSDSYSFSFASGRDADFSDRKIISESGCSHLQEIDNVILNAIRDAEPLLGLVPDRSAEDRIPEIPRNTVTLTVYEYFRGLLYFRIANGFDKNLELPMHVSLYRLGEDGSTEMLYDAAYTSPRTVYADNIQEEVLGQSISLAAGQYRLTVDDYETEFEIR